MRIGLYPGTFDPITVGHIDIIRRASVLVDKLVIGVAINADKSPMFSLDERVGMIKEECKIIENKFDIVVDVHPFQNLLIQCAREVNATIIIRGLRAVSDFEYELQLANMNRYLAKHIETAFLTPTEYAFVTSSLVREIATMGGNVSGFVSPVVEKALVDRFKTN